MMGLKPQTSMNMSCQLNPIKLKSDSSSMMLSFMGACGLTIII